MVAWLDQSVWESLNVPRANTMQTNGTTRGRRGVIDRWLDEGLERGLHVAGLGLPSLDAADHRDDMSVDVAAVTRLTFTFGLSTASMCSYHFGARAATVTRAGTGSSPASTRPSAARSSASHSRRGLAKLRELQDEVALSRA